MFRLFARRPRIGDRVDVRAGPFTGRTGPITSVAGDPPRYEVWLDDCCHPALAVTDFELRRTVLLDRLAVADAKRAHSPIGGYARDPDVALPVALSDLLDAADGGDRASSVVRDIQERHRAHHE